MTFPRTVPITEIRPGDIIELEGIDTDERNALIWPYELASVESVSTRTNPSGGWCDSYLDSPAGADLAIVYTDNGVVPSTIPITSMVELSAHVEQEDD